MMASDDTLFRFDHFEIDQSNVRLMANREIRPLEPKSFRLLVFLIENRARNGAKFADVTHSLNQALMEKDVLRDFQQSEIERQVQLRQVAWSDRLSQLRQELDAQRVANEAERTVMTREHHKKLLEVSEDWKTQGIQARRQMADAELAAEERSTKFADELKEALKARDAACSQMQLQAESLSLKLSQAKEDAAREMEKAGRQEKHRLSDLQAQAEQELRRREWVFERQLEAQSREADTRLREEIQQKELAFHAELKKREQELVTKANARETEMQNQWASEWRAREEEWEHQIESRVRAAETRLGHEAQQKEESFQSKSRQRDQQWQAKLETVRVELQAQTEQELRRLDAESAEAKQREQDLLARLSAQAKDHQVAAQEWETELGITRGTIESLRELLVRTEKERDEAKCSASEGVRQVQNLEKQLMEASSFLTSWRNGKNSVDA